MYQFKTMLGPNQAVDTALKEQKEWYAHRGVGVHMFPDFLRVSNLNLSCSLALD